MKKIIEEIAVNTDNATQRKPCDDKKEFAGLKMPYVSVLDLLKDMNVGEPSNNGGRVYRLGFIEIIEDENAEVVDTEGMSPEELEDLRTWEIEKAADEGRLRFHEIVLTEEEALRMGIRFLEPYHRVDMHHSITISGNHRGEPITANEKTGWRSLRPTSRPNKKNKGYSHYKY